ncbi:sulfurtransferase TusA family protein [Rhodovulum sulfidophilum]|uniref:SirA family protein n=1 Tax=Rhodovulum sulfidophilum TaxID=35806 RepID=A0A0D6B3F4_RHOSU|nr:sulfurtransferase TusA family protein [Rhodovulum sulfidophilum]MBL3552982.1 sulfurtransferase TusA family protein [Rhodovulum sulfidophilum]OLS49001.1 preprotein translocase subunit TatB [Rhodovulum sulfidophilum]BAQ69658.1 SirA family protein [Rhodovulum sulfidophilum]
MGPEIEIDLRGLKCPLPVLRARKALAALAPGNLLRLWADDPVAVIDIPHFCREAGHELVGTEETGTATLYLIRKG